MSKYFSNALLEAYKHRDMGGRRHDVVYASDASVSLVLGDETKVYGGCLRKQYYRITETPQSDPEGPGESFVAGVGEAVHDRVVAVFGTAEHLVSAEIPVWIEKIKLSGRIDAIIRPDKKRIGVEIKSVGGYRNITGTIKPTRNAPYAPKIGHLCQTLVYADHMFEKTDKEMDEWVIIYIDREMGSFAEHHIRYVSENEIWVNDEPSSITPARIYARWDTLWKHIENKTLPDRDYEMQYSKEKLKRMADAGALNRKDTQTVNAGKMVDKGSSECRWCSWQTQCWITDYNATT